VARRTEKEERKQASGKTAGPLGRARRRDEVQDWRDAVNQGRKKHGEVVGCVHVGCEESAIRMRLPRSVAQPPSGLCQSIEWMD